ncbi:lipopolysaccharide-induced tumor necrosis factor-alpha factor homolog [Temnothorax nylanderi]|uniref:lipopolysaccharide-induced tumor necrosis factor-alpha factor homolog n=1 Tax=Temnothorax nylanderi TaxID=102681 RepID=UPI003A85962C
MEEKMEQPPSYASSLPYPNLQPPPTMPLASHTVHTIITATVFGKENQRMTCPRCNADISTRVESAANMKTHLLALLLCLGGCCCCAPLPYCMDSCLVHKHYCPACSFFLGVSKN